MRARAIAIGAWLSPALLASCIEVKTFVPDDEVNGSGADAAVAVAPADGATASQAPSDASADAPDTRSDANGPVGRWCSFQKPTPLFCDDFDDATLGATWDGKNLEPPGNLALDIGATLSAPNALLATTGPSGGPLLPIASLRKDFGAKVKRATASVDVLFEELDGVGKPLVLTLGVSANLDVRGLQLSLNAGTSALIDLYDFENLANNPRHLLSKQPVKGKWVRVALDVDLRGPDALASVLFDDVPVLDKVKLVAGVPSPASPFVSLGLIPQEALTGAWKVRFDNYMIQIVE